MGSEKDLMYYKALVRKAVGEEGKALTYFIDNLNLLIGEQPRLAIALGVNAENI